MKKILVFTFIGPVLGVLLFFLPTFLMLIIFGDDGHQPLPLESLLVFPLFFIFGYYLAIVPAFLIGMTSNLLKFKNPWTNYGLLILSSIIICFIFFLDKRDDWFSLFVSMGTASTAILGYFLVLKGSDKKTIAKEVDTDVKL